MKLLLTGATGFVGRGALPALLAAGHEVHALVREASVAKLPQHPNCTPFTGDSLVAYDVRRALAGCDAVVHLVGIRREAIKRTGLGYDDVDVQSVRVMADAMNREKVSRILLLSAGAIGNSEYVQSKGRAEKVLIDGGYAWTIYRPSFVLGPGQMWPRTLEPVLALLGYAPGKLGDVARRARAVSREELAATMVWALGHPESIGHIYDVPMIRAIARSIRA